MPIAQLEQRTTGQARRARSSLGCTRPCELSIVVYGVDVDVDVESIKEGCSIAGNHPKGRELPKKVSLPLGIGR